MTAVCLQSFQDQEIRRRVGRALHNIVHAHPEQKQCKKEAKILRLLEVLRMYADFLRDLKACGDATLSRKGCGPLRLGVALEKGRSMLLCGKLPFCLFDNSDSQCGNFMIFLSLRFCVKSNLGILEVQNMPF